MRISLIGASGMVGSCLLRESVGRKCSVVAVARNPEKVEALPGVEIVGVDVHDVPTIVSLASNLDVVISALSPRSTDDAINDAKSFTEALISVSEQTGKRILMVGGGSSLQMPDGTSALELTPESILPEATGMRKAYAMLVTADIDFAVLAPGGMIGPGERTENFRLAGRTMITNEDGGKSNISAEDYAIAMLDEVESPRHFRTIFNVAY